MIPSGINSFHGCNWMFWYVYQQKGNKVKEENGENLVFNFIQKTRDRERTRRK
jgi:hypothetical protein